MKSQAPRQADTGLKPDLHFKGLKATNEWQDDGTGTSHQVAQHPIDHVHLHARCPCPSPRVLKPKPKSCHNHEAETGVLENRESKVGALEYHEDESGVSG